MVILRLTSLHSQFRTAKTGQHTHRAAKTAHPAQSMLVHTQDRQYTTVQHNAKNKAHVVQPTQPTHLGQHDKPAHTGHIQDDQLTTANQHTTAQPSSHRSTARKAHAVQPTQDRTAYTGQHTHHGTAHSIEHRQHSTTTAELCTLKSNVTLNPSSPISVLTC